MNKVIQQLSKTVSRLKFRIGGFSAGILITTASPFLVNCEIEKDQVVSRLKVDVKPADAAIKVGPSWITSGMLSWLEKSQKGALAQPRLVHDRLLALSLQELHPGRAVIAERLVMARAYLEHELEISEEKGPASVQEAAELNRRIGRELYRPRVVRTVDLLIPVRLPEDLEGPFALAKEFIELMKDVDSLESLLVAAEKLKSDIPFEFLRRAPVSKNGESYVLTPADYGLSPVTAVYAAIAAECIDSRVLSRVVSDSQGIHAIFCVDVIDGFERPMSEQTELSDVQLRSIRAGSQIALMIDSSRKNINIVIAPNTHQLTRRFWEDRASK